MTSWITPISKDILFLLERIVWKTLCLRVATYNPEYPDFWIFLRATHLTRLDERAGWKLLFDHIFLLVEPVKAFRLKNIYPNVNINFVFKNSCFLLIKKRFVSNFWFNSSLIYLVSKNYQGGCEKRKAVKNQIYHWP